MVISTVKSTILKPLEESLNEVSIVQISSACGHMYGRSSRFLLMLTDVDRPSILDSGLSGKESEKSTRKSESLLISACS